MPYPPWWRNTVTIYHRTVSAEHRVTWTRAVIKDICYMSAQGSSASSDSGNRSGVNPICRIPAPCPAIGLGDIIVAGVCVDEVDEYMPGKRSTDLLAAHKGKSFTVLELRDNSLPGLKMPHIHAEGR